MFSRKQLISATLVAGAIAALSAAVAMAAAPLPRAGKYYDNSKQTHTKASVFFLIGGNPDQVVKGADTSTTPRGAPAPSTAPRARRRQGSAARP